MSLCYEKCKGFVVGAILAVCAMIWAPAPASAQAPDPATVTITESVNMTGAIESLNTKLGVIMAACLVIFFAVLLVLRSVGWIGSFSKGRK